MALNNSQYNAIMREYEQIRFDNKRKQNQKIAEIYEKVPEIQQIDEMLPSKAVQRYKDYLKQKDKKVLDDMGDELRLLKSKKENLLKNNGFDIDDLDMKYNCEICKDTGFVDNKKCTCFQKKAIDMLYRVSNLKSISENNSFENINYEYYDNSQIIPKVNMSTREYMTKVVDYCKKYVEEFTTNNSNLVLMGNTGVGKTFLSQSIGRALVEKYNFVVYIESTDLFDQLAKSKFEKSFEESESAINEYIKDCDLLIIDDLGTELTNTWTSSQLFYVINDRLDKGKATIISTNLSLAELRDLYSERVSSRIIGSYTSLTLYGDDIRKKTR